MIIKDGMQATEEEIVSFLMIGQSNMAGRGNIEDVPPIRNPKCLMLRMGRWQHMNEPINPDRAIFAGKYRSGVGLAASFADSYSKEHENRVGLIPCADGGTPLSAWMPGEILFDHAVMMTKLAMRTSRFGGILWHQGENDCAKEELLQTYKERFIPMITAMRRELGAEELPVIIGEVSEYITDAWKMGDRPARLNGIFREIAAELPCCGVASSKDLALKADGIHFCSASCRTFGERYYDIYKELTKNN